MLRSAVVVAMLSGVVGVGICGSRTARAQEPQGPAGGQQGGQGGGQGQFAGMQRVGGEVTAVSGASVTVKTEAGETMQIVTTENTRVMKGRGGTVKVADLKVGDGLIAMGNMDAPNKTLHAAIVMATDAATVKALKENLGKTYITGKVTAVDADDAKMTIERPDKVAQTIGFDETTSFKRGGRSAMGAMGGGMGWRVWWGRWRAPGWGRSGCGGWSACGYRGEHHPGGYQGGGQCAGYWWAEGWGVCADGVCGGADGWRRAAARRRGRRAGRWAGGWRSSQGAGGPGSGVSWRQGFWVEVWNWD